MRLMRMAWPSTLCSHVTEGIMKPEILKQILSALRHLNELNDLLNLLLEYRSKYPQDKLDFRELMDRKNKLCASYADQLSSSVVSEGYLTEYAEKAILIHGYDAETKTLSVPKILHGYYHIEEIAQGRCNIQLFKEKGDSYQQVICEKSSHWVSLVLQELKIPARKEDGSPVNLSKLVIPEDSYLHKLVADLYATA